jgi:transcriptional regulator MraZ
VEGLLPLLHLGPTRRTALGTRDPMAFRGTFDYSLDAKSRLTVPAKFRASLSEGVVLAKGIERCVQLWTPSGFDRYTDAALKGVHPLSDEARKLTRFFSANSLDAELDAAGRVMVPGFLLEHAALRKEVVVTGAGDCLEVWDRAAWAEYNRALSNELPEITAAIGHAG